MVVITLRRDTGAQYRAIFKVAGSGRILNQQVLASRRKASSSVQECFHSWTYLHNESVNIYSHVLGALLFLALPGWVFNMIDFDLGIALPQRYQVATPTDIVVCTTYLVGVAVCFLLSMGFHTLMAHSEAVYLLGMKLDIQGVLVLMWGATIPLVYYVFPCDPSLRLGYWGLFTALAGLCSAVTFLPRFSGPHLGPYRAALFGSFGAGSFALPIAHGLARYGMEDMWRRVGLGWILATVACNGTGVGVYSMKVGSFGLIMLSFDAKDTMLTSCPVSRAMVPSKVRSSRSKSSTDAYLRRCRSPHLRLCCCTSFRLPTRTRYGLRKMNFMRRNSWSDDTPMEVMHGLQSFYCKVSPSYTLPFSSVR